MFKGTTPTISLMFPDTIDLTLATQIAVTFSDYRNNTILEKVGSELTVSAQQIDIDLTQEETLAMPKDVLIQVNFLYVDGATTRRSASTIQGLRFEKNLKAEVMI